MAFTQITLGLTLTIPTNGSRSWGSTLRSTTWTKISSHDHTGSGNGAQLSTAALTDNSVTQAKLSKNRGDYYFATPLVPAGTAQTIDWANGQVQVLDLGSATGDVTVTLSNPVTGGVYTVYVIQAATPLDIVWPAAVKWPQAQKPILSQVNDARDSVRLFYDGTNYFGEWELTYS